MNQEPKKKDSELQGEGNYAASRNYDAGVEASVEKGKSEELAEKAKEALDGAEGASLREAEEQGKKAQIKK